jgi:hypothetical protein
MGHSTSHSNRSTPRLTINEILTTLDSKIPHLNYTIDHLNFKDSCLELIHLVFPQWFGSPANTEPANIIKLVQCTEGITNKRKFQNANRVNYFFKIKKSSYEMQELNHRTGCTDTGLRAKV